MVVDAEYLYAAHAVGANFLHSESFHSYTPFVKIWSKTDQFVRNVCLSDFSTGATGGFFRYHRCKKDYVGGNMRP